MSALLEHKWGESRYADRVYAQVSGLAPRHLARRGLMNLQAFVDESFSDDVFVMAGYLAHPDAWVKFSHDWEELLHLGVIDDAGDYHFKMAQMAMSGERMKRVPAFYRVIERHADLAISVQFKIADIRGALRRITIPGHKINWAGWRNPYLFAFRALTDVIHGRRSELEPVLKAYDEIDFIFDERAEKDKVVWAWDRIRKAMPKEAGALYGATPRFEDDKEFLPLQAADFWAWWLRKWVEEQDTGVIKHGAFPWSYDEEKPPKLYVTVDENGAIEYLTNILQSNIPAGKKIAILPPST